MRSMIIVFATIGAIGIGVAEVSAADDRNLSCITETTADGKTVRDCVHYKMPIFVLSVIQPAPPPPTPPTFERDGGRKSDGRDDRGGTVR